MLSRGGSQRHQGPRLHLFIAPCVTGRNHFRKNKSKRFDYRFSCGVYSDRANFANVKREPKLANLACARSVRRQATAGKADVCRSAIADRRARTVVVNGVVPPADDGAARQRRTDCAEQNAAPSSIAVPLAGCAWQSAEQGPKSGLPDLRQAAQLPAQAQGISRRRK